MGWTYGILKKKIPAIGGDEFVYKVCEIYPEEGFDGLPAYCEPSPAGFSAEDVILDLRMMLKDITAKTAVCLEVDENGKVLQVTPLFKESNDD